MKPLILCVDRDDDIGRNVGVQGPIVGRGENLDVAQKLALADPADTDVNALYGALKLAGELDAEVVTLTGDQNVGVVSDREVAIQLDEVIQDLKPSSVIFVSDGLDDEQVIPLIQSRVKIDSVQTITVRQSKELEKAYFKLAHFIKEVTEDPNLSRLIFGVPGLALLLLALGGARALSLIMGVVGAYLVIRGFGWEEEFFNKTSEFLKSLSVERISTVVYFIAFVTFALGMSYAYGDLQKSALSFTDFNTTLNTLALFILNSSSVNLITLTVVTVIAARMVDDWTAKRFIQVRRYFILAAFILLIRVVLEAGARYMINEDFGFGNFMLNGILGVVSLAIWIRMTEYFFIQEIEVIDRITRETEGKEVYDAEGKRIGKVSRAVVEDLELKDIRVGRITIPKDKIVSVGDTVVVEAEK